MSDSIEIDIPAEDVQVGDRIMNWNWRHKAGASMPNAISVGGNTWKVVRVDKGKDDRNYGVYHSVNGGAERVFWSGDTGLTVRVVRAGASKPSSKPSGKKIDDYPHTCTRCGSRAYVGLFEVSHAPGAGGGCPARSA